MIFLKKIFFEIFLGMNVLGDDFFWRCFFFEIFVEIFVEIFLKMIFF